MRIPNKLLVPAAVLALGACLAACSISVGGPGGESASEQTNATAATDAPTQESDDTVDDTATDDADTTDTTDADDTEDAGGASASGTNGITDPDWLDAIANGYRQEVSGDHGVQSAGGTHNLVGDLDSLAIQGSGSIVAAESVGSLTVQGSNVTVYVRDVDDVTVMGSNVKVRYLSGEPTVQDFGAGNSIRKLAN